MNNTSSMQYINHICNNLKLNRASVLIGAGFSRNANKQSSFAPNYPLWLELGNIFARKISSTEIEYDNLKNLSPIILADRVEAVFGRSELEKTILETIPDNQYLPAILHTKLLQTSWKDVFTTNYDTLLERASENISYKRFNVVTC